MYVVGVVSMRCMLDFFMSSWQSCTGDAVPRVVNMHGVRVVYMYEEGEGSV